MQSITEDIIDGSCCALCNQYFEHPKKDEAGKSIGIYCHDYPVACSDCWTMECGYEKAEVKTFGSET